ncbi:MAG: response regulator transcription factor [Deltaproteobacteria bacterium]
MALRVLVIDDSRFTIELVRGGLEGEFEVIPAENGREGLKLARTELPDIIVLDLVLPDIPGESVCRELKRGKTETIPVIMLTAKNSDVDKVVGRVIGADAYIPKPFQMEELLSVIRQLSGKGNG